MKLYLAHPIDLRKGIREIELFIEDTLKVELLNPFYDTGRTDIIEIDAGTKTRWDTDLYYNDIVKNDLEAIESCDGIVAFIEKKTFAIGTLFEIWHCYKVLEKPVFIITPDCGKHPWIRHIVTRNGGNIFSTWNEFYRYLEEKL